MSSISRVEEFFRRGRFDEAAEVMRGLSESELTWSGLALKADVLDRSGRSLDAVVIAERICRNGKQCGLAAGRASLTRGVIELELETASKSVTTLNEAIAIADSYGDVDTTCWARVRMVLSGSEADARFDLESAIISAKTAAEQTGELPALIALNVFASEAYAKRGALETAYKYATNARELLRATDNPWLNGLTDTAEFCVAYLRMDFVRAEVSADEALRNFRIAGHVRGELAAIINLAHLRVRQGRADDAGRMLRRALSMCDISRRCRDCVRDGLAQLAMSRGELRTSSDLIQQVLDGGAPCHSYPRVWSLLTRAEVLLSEQRYLECQRQCAEVLGHAERIGDRGLAMRLRLVLAESLVREGRTDEAGQALVAARLDSNGFPLSILAEFNSRAARILAYGREPEMADRLSDRARRLYALYEPKRRTRRNGYDEPVALSRVDKDEKCADSLSHRTGTVLDRVASLVEQRENRELLATELVSLITDTGCVSRWALLREDRSGRRQLLAAAGWKDLADVRSAMVEPRIQRIAVSGPHATLTAVFEPQPSLLAYEVIAAVQRIVWRCTLEPQSGGERVVEATYRESLSPIMSEVIALAGRVAGTTATVLLTGETGVGKDWLARKIHGWSDRRQAPYVAFNCAAVPRDMLEAQLFGHRQGAFTGAQQSALGVIRGANGGTLLLDEVAELPLELQPKLLRFLEQNEVHPLGEPRPMSVNVRVIAATNRPVERLLQAGQLREDLFYRLNVVSIEIPPLRRRRDEIETLARRSLIAFASEYQKGTLTLGALALDVLRSYDWPGNVRQLLNVMKRAAALALPGATIGPDLLSREMLAGTGTKTQAEVLISADQPLMSAVSELERACITRAINLSAGGKEAAASLLGISRKGLYLKCRRLGLNV